MKLRLAALMTLGVLVCALVHLAIAIFLPAPGSIFSRRPEDPRHRARIEMPVLTIVLLDDPDDRIASEFASSALCSWADGITGNAMLMQLYPESDRSYFRRDSWPKNDQLAIDPWGYPYRVIVEKSRCVASEPNEFNLILRSWGPNGLDDAGGGDDLGELIWRGVVTCVDQQSNTGIPRGAGGGRA